ncbi:LLM class flavin-dependent oxidoreductase [Streptomyces sp. NPDC048297]|uniref:LLM class flavin-dependent oxidoreductase n=1 Tax=Streptomyces sp. NPDC048297 TaxID=3365531 RepID=UPI0037100DD3
MTSERLMRLAASVKGLGYHPSGWRYPGAATTADLGFYTQMAHLAERGLFDLLFVPDRLAVAMYDSPPGALGRSCAVTDLEPLTLLAALAPVTRHLGLAATVSTTFTEPYHIARSFASLDHISAGRAAWNVVTSTLDEEAHNFGMKGMPAKAERYARAREAVDVVTRLWKSWEADAFVRDTSSGKYFDPDKVHYLDHQGQFFQVRGPLNVPRPPQGRPVIIQAGASPGGRELAAETADVVYTVQNTLEAAQAYYTDVKNRMAAYGRRPDELLVMPGILSVVADTEAEARAKYQAMQENVDPMLGLAHLSLMVGDLSSYDLDGPVPPIPEDARVPSRRRVWTNLARERGLTIRQFFQTIAIANGHLEAVGTPGQIADVMEEWFTEGAADGFNVMSAVAPASLDEFTRYVVPELQRRGLFRTAYERRTLRENLGLN